MGEPEDVLTDAAEFGTEAALGLWRRRAAGAESHAVQLAEVKRRLELFLSATFGRHPKVVVSQPPRTPNVVTRWFKNIPAFSVQREAFPSTDGVRIRLPEQVGFEPEAFEDEEAARQSAAVRYRLYAVEQTGRILRGTVGETPADERDAVRVLYLLAEAVAVDREIVRTLSGLREDLVRERRRGLGRRPSRSEMNAAEAHVEGIYREVLQAEPGEETERVPVCERPAASLAWAREYVGKNVDREAFRGLPAVQVWGRVETEYAPGSGTESHRAERENEGSEQRSRELERRPKAREPEEDEDDDKEGSWFVPSDDLHETAQDPMGLQRPVDRDDAADPDELAESLAEMEEGRLVRTDDQAREVLSSDDPPPRSFSTSVAGEVDGVAYPEWNYRMDAYESEKAVVRPQETKLGPEGWVTEALQENSQLVYEVRRCFEQLQPRRERLRRQSEGEEIDLSAYVEAYGDRLAGRPATERLYQKVRPRRREVAIELLVDISASTDSWVKDDKRVIDVEKLALLMVCEALDALGDRYGITAFSGRGPRQVMTWRLKDFEERYRPAVKRRIAALEPQRYTRAGAAIRHSTVQLDEQGVRHPLLLMLSDGKPNDLDEYETEYGVEDTRQAVPEARLQGINVFCLTVDHDAPSYMNRIFGPSSFGVLRQPELLPRVLVDVVRRLLDR